MRFHFLLQGISNSGIKPVSLMSPELAGEFFTIVLPDVLPVVQVPGRERRLLETMQLAIGEFTTD